MIPACKLWPKVSAKGNSYLIGRMGGVRVMVMANTRPEPGDNSTHVLMFAEAPQRQAAPPAGQSQPEPAHRRASPSHAKTHQLDDDPVPF